jgi:cytochrome bd ubiquinol oxidase subunit II
MTHAAFLILWVYLALFVVLAGGDFGVGIWVFVTSLSTTRRRFADVAMAYFSPVWEMHGLFLIFFLTGLLFAFPAALGVLGSSLIALLIVALATLVLRAAFYVLLTHGPPRVSSRSRVGFGLSSLACAIAFGLTGAAPASGDISHASLGSAYFTSAVALTAIPLAMSAAAHLGAVGIWNHSLNRDPEAAGWYQRAAAGAGVASLASGAAFTAAIALAAPGTRAHVLSTSGAVLLGGGVMVAVAVLFAILGHARAALLLTTCGYAIGLIGGAFVQLPYVVYPTLTLSAAASPPAVIQDFLITAVIGAPLVILAVAAWHVLSLRPSASETALRPPG